MEFVGLRPKKDACKASYLTGQDTATLPNWSLESSLGEVAKCWSWKRAAVLSKLKLLFVVGEGWFSTLLSWNTTFVQLDGAMTCKLHR